MSMNIVGLHGPSGVGKDTLINYTREKHDNITHLKFAAPLRAIVYTLKELTWSRVTVGNKHYEETDGITDLLVSFNEVYRPIVPDLMVRGLLYLVHNEQVWWEERTILVSDVRQPNEYDCIVHTLGGEVAHLTRETCAREPRALDNLLQDRRMVALPLRAYLHWDNVIDLEEIIQGTPETQWARWDSRDLYESGLNEILQVLHPSYNTCERGNVIANILQRTHDYIHWLN
jgi:hypothetical protein